ncbi:MAG: RNA methyltransferase [Cyanobacteria bacterium P01_C01_bin.120]
MPSRSLSAPDARHALVFCASLVQNPMNLGALCRTAEVLQLQELVLSSTHISADPAFRKVAVSAERWQPISVCAVEQLPVWITQQQRQAATVIALTRHTRAVSLTRFAFPRQSVLLLGRELTGIPSSLLEQCDQMVEIPQWGRVESLNVSTAAAIAAYEYLRQHGETLQ